MKPGRSTTVRLACTKCGDDIALTAPTYRHGPKVELREYLNRMAEQWLWDLTKRAEVCGWCRGLVAENPASDSWSKP
jgi:hypothetical protein